MYFKLCIWCLCILHSCAVTRSCERYTTCVTFVNSRCTNSNAAERSRLALLRTRHTLFEECSKVLAQFSADSDPVWPFWLSDASVPNLFLLQSKGETVVDIYDIEAAARGQGWQGGGEAVTALGKQRRRGSDGGGEAATAHGGGAVL